MCLCVWKRNRNRQREIGQNLFFSVSHGQKSMKDVGLVLSSNATDRALEKEKIIQWLHSTYYIAIIMTMSRVISYF